MKLNQVIDWLRFTKKLIRYYKDQGETGQAPLVFALRDCYQGSRLLEGWLIKAGIPSIEEVSHEAKKEYRL